MARFPLLLCPLALFAVGCSAHHDSSILDASSQRRGKLVADSMFFIACDFATDIWHNGQLVPPERRHMDAEIYGRTIERDQIKIRQGDWLVLRLAHNPLRENGAKLFMLTLLKDGEPVLKSDDSANWSTVSDPTQAEAFIRSSKSAADSDVEIIPPNERWNDGYQRFQQAYGGIGAKPIWGEGTVVWIKLRVPRGAKPEASSDR